MFTHAPRHAVPVPRAFESTDFRFSVLVKTPMTPERLLALYLYDRHRVAHVNAHAILALAIYHMAKVLDAPAYPPIARSVTRMVNELSLHELYAAWSTCYAEYIQVGARSKMTTSMPDVRRVPREEGVAKLRTWLLYKIAESNA